MTTISEARLAIQNYLSAMNLSPYNVMITGFNTEESKWTIDGQFQSGFVGETFTFTVTYDPLTRIVSKFNITGKQSGVRDAV